MTDKKDCLRELERKLQNAECRLSVVSQICPTNNEISGLTGMLV
jgi:hypothetical protein